MGVWSIGFVVFGWDGVDFAVWDATIAEDTESASIVFHLYIVDLSCLLNLALEYGVYNNWLKRRYWRLSRFLFSKNLWFDASLYNPFCLFQPYLVFSAQYFVTAYMQVRAGHMIHCILFCSCTFVHASDLFWYIVQLSMYQSSEGIIVQQHLNTIRDTSVKPFPSFKMRTI